MGSIVLDIGRFRSSPIVFLVCAIITFCRSHKHPVRVGVEDKFGGIGVRSEEEVGVVLIVLVVYQINLELP